MRGELKEAGWRARREEFVGPVAKAWGLKGVVTKGRETEKRERKKAKGDPEDRKYVYHEKDRNWESVGKRCKLVCDSETTVRLLNEQAAAETHTKN